MTPETKLGKIVFLVIVLILGGAELFFGVKCLIVGQCYVRFPAIHTTALLNGWGAILASLLTVIIGALFVFLALLALWVVLFKRKQ